MLALHKERMRISLKVLFKLFINALSILGKASRIDKEGVYI